MLKKPARYDNCVLLAEHHAEPKHKEAIASKESSEWLAAMKEEIGFLGGQTIPEACESTTRSKSNWKSVGLAKLRRMLAELFSALKYRPLSQRLQSKVGVILMKPLVLLQ
ncbi:hypothetical protein AVEN_140133-1 [Araneus ventricosus]|uniref:Retrovirus-related Pol polyprotein from transposon TNT 1-94 n=1 Tax=Araneus ventricosus TaxID=182803 RepID=A0A4Y2ILC0_ARAVE|nr:hypothetical protein AVEN_140133-1 [Araneus ventricosus]